MRSSTVVTLLCAGLAIASPLHKKAITYDIFTDIVYVTVTDGEEPATSAGPSTHYHHVHTSTASPTTSVITPSTPAAAPYTTPTPVTSPAEAVYIPEPSTTQTPVSTVASTSVEAAAVASPTDFQSTALYHHNIHRANNSVSDLTWDSTIAGYAATVAATCVYAHDLTPGGGGYGQNIAVYGSSGDVEADGSSSMIAMAATDMWYNGEVNLFLPSYYGEANPDFSNFESWGHYSQMVWKSTTGVGCAVQFCAAGTIYPSMGSWFSVCNYNPPGNMGGAYGTNVLKPLGQDTVTS